MSGAWPELGRSWGESGRRGRGVRGLPSAPGAPHYALPRSSPPCLMMLGFARALIPLLGSIDLPAVSYLRAPSAAEQPARYAGLLLDALRPPSRRTG
eukprot:5562225-Pyramimonas_sp.AAC.1